jgi:hypothetical protein
MDPPKGYNFATSSHQLIKSSNIKHFIDWKYRKDKTFPVPGECPNFKLYQDQKQLDMKSLQYINNPISYRPVNDESLLAEKQYHQQSAKNILLLNKTVAEDFDILFAEE